MEGPQKCPLHAHMADLTCPAPGSKVLTFKEPSSGSSRPCTCDGQEECSQERAVSCSENLIPEGRQGGRGNQNQTSTDSRLNTTAQVLPYKESLQLLYSTVSTLGHFYVMYIYIPKVSELANAIHTNALQTSFESVLLTRRALCFKICSAFFSEMFFLPTMGKDFPAAISYSHFHISF